MKRIMLLATVAVVMAALLAAAPAWAAKPVEQGCTFNKGKTTCTTTEHTGTTYYTHVVGEERCGNAITGFYYEPVFQNYRTDTYRETTTVSRGNKIISAQSREYQTTTLVGGRYGGC